MVIYLVMDHFWDSSHGLAQRLLVRDSSSTFFCIFNVRDPPTIGKDKPPALEGSLLNVRRSSIKFAFSCWFSGIILLYI